MSKMVMGLILVIAIEFALLLFPGQADQTNSLFQFILNPADSGFNGFLVCSGLTCTSADAGTNNFILTIQLVFVAFIAISAISAGTGFVFKQDTVIFVTMAAFIGTFLLSIIKLWVNIYSNLGSIGTPTNSILASIMTAPLFVAWFVLILDWSRGKE